MSQTETHVNEAISEILKNPENYRDLIEILRRKDKNPMELLAAGAKAVQEAQKDIEALQPVISQVATAVKEGVSTSEYRMATTVNKILTIILICSPFLDAISTTLQSGTFGTGLIVSGVAAVLKVIVTVSYINSRKAVKINQK